jgi:hypothetical protein
LHQVGDLFELNVKPLCQKLKQLLASIYLYIRRMQNKLGQAAQTQNLPDISL